jgi:glycosyltransferase involved in cell wall biosynthesis
MRLAIWHCDRYPTAPGVYLGCFPGMGHQVTWVVSTTGPRNQVLARVEGGARILEVQRRRDASLPRPLSVFVNRWNKLVAFVLKAKLMRRLARERPDILQVRDLITEGLLAGFFAGLYRVPFTFQLDHPHPEGRILDLEHEGGGRPLERLAQHCWIWLRRRVLHRAQVVFPISDGLAERLRDHEGVDPRRLVPFPVGISRRTFERAGQEAVSPRAAAAAGFPTVCYLGNLHARRDPGLLFGILAELARRAPDYRFLVVGESTPEAERHMRDFPARDRLIFTGFVAHEEVPSLLTAAWVGLYALSLDDRFGVNRTCSPLKVVEYMSAGLPVVASRVGDAEKMVGESGGGVCVANDPGAFADAVERYLRDRELARRDGAKGRAYVGTHRLFDVLAVEVEAAYRRLLASGVPAAPESPLLRAPVV